MEKNIVYVNKINNIFLQTLQENDSLETDFSVSNIEKSVSKLLRNGFRNGFTLLLYISLQISLETDFEIPFLNRNRFVMDFFHYKLEMESRRFYFHF